MNFTSQNQRNTLQIVNYEPLIRTLNQFRMQIEKVQALGVDAWGCAMPMLAWTKFDITNFEMSFFHLLVYRHVQM